MSKDTRHVHTRRTLLVHTAFFFLVVLLSYATYFHNYHQPQAFYWDENYYVTDAQKTMNGVFYMQIHPPFGKMLLAAGEMLLQKSAVNDQYLDTEHAKEFPSDGFSLTGYRFFPALLSWAGGGVLFLIFLLLTGKPILSFFLSFLYIFDNALIVHNRGAMLDGPALFFFMSSVLLFLLVLHWKKNLWIFAFLSFLLGASVAAGFLVKFQGLIAILFIPALFWFLFPDRKRMLWLTLSAGAGFTLVFISIWQVHFSSMHTVNPVLRSGGYFNASERYKEILANGTQGSLRNFPLMLRDTVDYVPKYNSGIPKLNLCKPDENGSPWFFWPFGIKSISYRWSSAGDSAHRYLYLQSNPFIWTIGLVGVLLSFAYLAGTVFFSVPRSTHHRMIIVFSGIYVAYMGVMAQMDRVLFLYTYFLPLVLSFLLFGLLFDDLAAIAGKKLQPNVKLAIVSAIGAASVLSFLFYSPLTYYKPLSKEAFARRDIFRLWDMRCANCEKKKTLCFPA